MFFGGNIQDLESPCLLGRSPFALPSSLPHASNDKINGNLIQICFKMRQEINTYFTILMELIYCAMRGNFPLSTSRFLLHYKAGYQSYD